MNGATFLDGFGERVYGEVRALAWSVNGKETEVNGLDAVKVCVIGAELFACEFGGGVRGDCLIQAHVFAERRSFDDAVDGRT